MSCSKAAIPLVISDILSLYFVLSIAFVTLNLADIEGRIIATNFPSSVTRQSPSKYLRIGPAVPWPTRTPANIVFTVC